MYIPNEEKKLWEKRNKYFSKSTLYICKEDIQCEHGTFNKGTLVKVSLCGTNDSKLNFGIYENRSESVQSIFTHFNYCFLRISDMDEFYGDYHYISRTTPLPESTDIYRVTTDNIDDIICLFESQEELEQNIDNVNDTVFSYRKKSDDYDNIKAFCFISTIVLPIIFSIIWKYIFNSFLSIAFFTSIIALITIGVTSAKICSHIADKYLNIAYDTEKKSINQCYTKWKSTT